MLEIKLRNLEELLNLKLNKNECMTYTTKPLLATGENYGSTILAVDVRIFEKDRENEATEYHYVAKMCPPSELLRDVFNIPVSYKKELGVYTDIVPTLQQFQRENGIEDVMDFFAKLHGARISLDPNSKSVDDDAVMLFENLKYEGYQVVDRFKGFDLECAKFLIKDLAVMHAVPLAFKLRHSEEFQGKVYVHLKGNFEFKIDDKMKGATVDNILKVARNDKDCVKYISKIKEALCRNSKMYENRSKPREPFATMTHNDYWVNNTMIKFENDRPVKNVIVDFQILEYGSPGNDVIFFLFSSVQSSVVAANYDMLIDLYYETFIDMLRKLKCDISMFTFESFQRELAESAKTLQFYHIMMMLTPIFTKKGAVKELNEFGMNDFLVDGSLAEEYDHKVCFVIKEFQKRNWLDI